MNRRAEMPRSLFGVPDRGMAPHGDAGYGQGGQKSHHCGGGEIVLDITSGQERHEHSDDNLSEF